MSLNGILHLQALIETLNQINLGEQTQKFLVGIQFLKLVQKRMVVRKITAIHLEY